LLIDACHTVNGVQSFLAVRVIILAVQVAEILGRLLSWFTRLSKVVQELVLKFCVTVIQSIVVWNVSQATKSLGKVILST